MGKLAVFTLLIAGAWGQAEYDVVTAAGSDWVGDGGPARLALLFQAEGVAVDRVGNVFIADSAAGVVRRVDADNVTETVVSGLAAPYGLAFDPAGKLHIAELGRQRVVRLESDGALSVIADTGLAAPRNIAFDRAGNLYISDFEGHSVYRRAAGGAMTVAAGPSVLSFPTGVAVDAAGAVYIGDSQHHLIRKVEGSAVTTFAPVGTPTGMAFDRAGVLHVADAFTGQVLRFGVNGALVPLNVAARDVAFASDGTLYVSQGDLVRRIGGGVTSIFAGGGNWAHGDFGLATEARLRGPTGVAVDEAGNLYIADRDNHRVRRVSVDGIITTLAGAGLPGASGDGGPATRALLNSPADVAVDRAGNVFIADGGNRRVRVVTPGGIVQTIVSGVAFAGVAVDESGTVYARDETFVYRLGLGEALTRVVAPESVAADLAGRAVGPNGVIYVADADAHRVFAFVPRPAPVIDIDVVHAATLSATAVAPRMLLRVRGVPEGAEIRCNGIVVPELARTGLEVTIQALVTGDSATIEVRKTGAASGVVTLPVAVAAPGLFAAVTADGSPPERGGILVLYGTGEGVSGAPVSVTIGGYEAEVLYSGAVAAYPGLWQVNARAPAGYLPPGEHAVVAAVAGFASPPLTIALR